MAFYTQIDYSRQLKQSGDTRATLSGSSLLHDELWAGYPSYITGYVGTAATTSYSGNSGYTFIVQTANGDGLVVDNTGSDIYKDGRISTYSVSVTSYSGTSTGNTVLSIGTSPLLPLDVGNSTPSLTASCLQIATSNLISASATDLGIDTLGNVVRDTSSRRFKENIKNIIFTNLDRLLKLTPKKFTWKSNKSEDWGYIAEEVDSVGLTDFVNYEGGLPYSVKYKKLTILLIEYLKKYGFDGSVPEIKCDCPKEEFVVLTEDTDYVLDSSKSKKYIIKSLANCNIAPDTGLIDNEWESLEMLPESCVEFRFYEPLSSWMIVSSDGLKES